MAAIPYYAFGGDAQDNVALSISSGPLKVTVEIMYELITCFHESTKKFSRNCICLLFYQLGRIFLIEFKLKKKS